MSVPIQDPGVGSRLLEFLGIKGRYKPGLEEFIVPTIQVGDLSVAGIPPVSRHASVRMSVAAVVGQYPVFSLTAPPGLVCVITDFQFSTSADTLLAADFRDLSLCTPITPYFTDNRITLGEVSPAQVPAAIVGVETQVAPLGLAAWYAYLETNVGRHFAPKGWVIGSGLPGATGHFHLGFTENNKSMVGAVEWDEYQVF